MLYARTSTADHHFSMSTARRGDAMKAGQPIAAHPSAGAQVLLRPSGDFGGAKPLHDRQLHAQRMSLLIGLDGGHERGLRRCPPPALAPASLPPEIGVIEFDPTGEREVAVSLHHHLHQLVPDAPRRVVGATQVAVRSAQWLDQGSPGIPALQRAGVGQGARGMELGVSGIEHQASATASGSVRAPVRRETGAGTSPSGVLPDPSDLLACPTRHCQRGVPALVSVHTSQSCPSIRSRVLNYLSTAQTPSMWQMAKVRSARLRV